jgi:hypothetical protein
MTDESDGSLSRDAPRHGIAPEVLSKHIGSDPDKGLTAQLRDKVKASGTR